MATQWPRVRLAVLSILPTLPGWGAVQVFDGPPVTQDNPATYAFVGYVPSDAHAGTYHTYRAPDGFRWEEEGQVRCYLAANNGDGNLAAAYTALIALADAWEANIRADRTLGGVLSPDSSVDLTVDVESTQNEAGAGAALLLSLTYTTVT